MHKIILLSNRSRNFFGFANGFRFKTSFTRQERYLSSVSYIEIEKKFRFKKEDETKLRNYGAKFISEKSFEDEYFDCETKNYPLTRNDICEQIFFFAFSNLFFFFLTGIIWLRASKT